MTNPPETPSTTTSSPTTSSPTRGVAGIRPIRSILVANRGEIARRVFRTCGDLGITTVAVFSDPDDAAPHVREADLAVHLPGTALSETYLNIERLIDAAVRSGADAIHPGYGFLSESAEFARAVESSGLVWIGPPPEAMERMGSKVESKLMMAGAGVPVLDQIPPDGVSAADLPVLVKASAGGGGRGMRVVRTLEALPGEIEAAGAEAASAFGDPTVFCEPYLETGHHVEVQVMADRHGAVWTVGERECSIQRRHQKIVEEAPSPLVERIDGMRSRLFAAAESATRAVDYLGAGTVEFLADEQGRFFFLEMNTRLQVEHPVTECTTGLDLVALQIEVAQGRRLADGPPVPSGHSIEVRLYAEDPAAGWTPQSGVLHTFEVPVERTRFDLPARPGIRVDSAVESGSVIGVNFDPMLAKVISWAPTRDRTANMLAAALSGARIHGVATNRDMLVNTLRHQAFLDGDTDTAFIETHGLEALSQPLLSEQTRSRSLLAAALCLAEATRSDAILPGLRPAWRNIASQPVVKRFRQGGTIHEVSYRFDRDALVAEGHPDVTSVAVSSTGATLGFDGVLHRFDLTVADGVANADEAVFVDSWNGSLAVQIVSPFPDAEDDVAPGSLLAPMPGAVIRIAVQVGDVVDQGQALLWLEAMKMQHEIVAPCAGTVTEIRSGVGEQVEVGAVLAVVTPRDEGDEGTAGKTEEQA